MEGVGRGNSFTGPVRTGPMEKGSGRRYKGPGLMVSIRNMVQEQERAKEDIAPHLLLPHPAREFHWANLPIAG